MTGQLLQRWYLAIQKSPDPALMLSWSALYAYQALDRGFDETQF